MSRSALWIGGVASIGLVVTLLRAGSPETPGDRPPETELGQMQVYPQDKVKWRKGPESLPPGAEIAVLEGDPSKTGPFVFRVKVPDGYTIPPHTHPKAERVTVIAGTFHIAMSEKIDRTAGQAMPAGSFGYWPAGMKHFAWVTGETVVQFHGIGPWQIRYLNPADDPRNAGKK
jgi:quercetin dioxygenase-like cupin family protein